MDKRLKTRWVKALRSGKYKQGTGFLRYITRDSKTNKVTKTEYCCLGVLCDVMKQERPSDGGFLLQDEGNVGRSTTFSNTTLFGATRARIALGGADPNILINMNDGDMATGIKRRTFRGIAQWIERNL